MTPEAFLAFCTRVQPSRVYDAALLARCQKVASWQAVGQLAQKHSMGPLLFAQMQRIGYQLPVAVKRPLHAQTIRQKKQSQIQTTVLAEILKRFAEHGIEPLLLKGAALRQLVYPEAWLRPMNDIDLLVKPYDIQRANHLLMQMGFSVPSVGKELPYDKHLEMAVKSVSGVTVGVELHHNLYNPYQKVSFKLGEQKRPLHTFTLNGIRCQSLSHEEMLWHLCEHLSYHASVWEPIRFIWVADMIAYAEKFVDQIDWTFVRQQFPSVLKRLSLFHAMTPLSPQLLEATAVPTGASITRLGEEFGGWTRDEQGLLTAKNRRQRLIETVFPSEWWLRLHYNLDGVQSCFWQRWLLHPLYVLGPLYLIEKGRLMWHQRIRPLWQRQHRPHTQPAQSSLPQARKRKA